MIQPPNFKRFHPIAAATLTALGSQGAFAQTDAVQVRVNYPNLTVTIPAGLELGTFNMLVVPRSSPVPISQEEFRRVALDMSKAGAPTYEVDSTTVSPVLGSKSASCQTYPCTVALTIGDPSVGGIATDLTSGAAYGWTTFIDGDYDLLLQDNVIVAGAVYTVPFSYLTNAAPTADDVAITGTAQVGVELAGTYAYSDTENDPEDASTFRWVRNSVNTGVADGTTVASTQSYTPVADDTGSHLYFCVTPMASTGRISGSEVCSPATAAVLAAPVDGSCGAAANVSTAYIPRAALCLAGTAGSVEPVGNSSWGWSCTGTNGGAATNCAAPFADVLSSGTTGAIQVSGVNNWQIQTAASGFVALPAAAPAGITFPQGATKVVLEGGTPGSSATVTLLLSNLPAGAKLYKYGKTNGLGDVNTWFEFPATINYDTNTVTYTLTDGLQGDNDGAANGLIEDPVALGVASSSNSIVGVPTLTQWAMVILSALMVGAAALRRRRSAQRA